MLFRYIDGRGGFRVCPRRKKVAEWQSRPSPSRSARFLHHGAGGGATILPSMWYPETDDELVVLVRRRAGSYLGSGSPDVRVLEAMRAIDGASFLPADARGEAYRDTPVPIGPGRACSTPSSSLPACACSRWAPAAAMPPPPSRPGPGQGRLGGSCLRQAPGKEELRPSPGTSAAACRPRGARGERHCRGRDPPSSRSCGMSGKE